MAVTRGTQVLASNFQFEERGQVFSCFTDAPKGPPAARAKHWWWFKVSGDESKYAPFKAGGEDTEASVRQRVAQYYFERLARRSEPSRPFGGGRRPNPPAAAATAPTEQATEQA